MPTISDRQSKPSLRVIVAHDSASLRATIRRLLEEAGCSVCGEADAAQTAVEVTTAQHPDVVLLGVALSGKGLGAVSEIAQTLSDVRVVMLASDDDDELVAALRAGAHGYLSTDNDLGGLAHALEAVRDGEIALPRRLVARVIDELRSPESSVRMRLDGDRGARLSDREWQVLELLAEGRTTAEIAERHFVAAVTVRSQVSSVLKKLGVADRAAAIALLVEAAQDADR